MSRLFERMMVGCHMRIKTPNPDGEGGNITAWADGNALSAAIVKNTDVEAKIAEKETSTATYTVTCAVRLAFHDVIRRDGDGMLFRVTSRSTDSKPPDEATFAFYQVDAEEWSES